MPDLDRVEPELVLAVGAVGHLVRGGLGAVVIGEVAVAVVPQVDVVEVFHVEGLLDTFSGHIDDLVGQIVVWEVDVDGGGVNVDVGGVGSEEVHVVVGGDVSVRPTQADED